MLFLKFLKDRILSFRYAVAGLKDILWTEHSAWIHAFFTAAAVGLSLWLNIETVPFLLIVVAIALVWIAEAFNTVLELIIDIVSPQYSATARRAKDIAAAAVLFAAFAAFVLGLVILGPPLWLKISGGVMP